MLQQSLNCHVQELGSIRSLSSLVARDSVHSFRNIFKRAPGDKTPKESCSVQGTRIQPVHILSLPNITFMGFLE